jgi:3-hydroxyacyl-CoA dehydrogenase
VELPTDQQSFAALFASHSPGGRLVQDIMASTLCYAADLVPEIADDIVNIDRAMRWGFAWQRGPFELIDEIGAHTLIDLVNEHEMSMPAMLQVMIDAGETSFYRNDGREFLTMKGHWAEVPE